MNYSSLLLSVMFSGLLTACATQKDIQPHDWALEVQNAETRSAHLLLADHYEEVARTMDADAEEEKRMLAKYNDQPYKYGKQILDLRSRTQGMINSFEKAAQESRKMAEYHRQLAEGNKK